MKLNSYLLLFCTFCFSLSSFSQMRKSTLLTNDWKFHKGEVASNNPNVESWEDVKVPHTWNLLDGQNGSGSDAWNDASYYRGAGVYSRQIFISKKEIDNQIILRFEAVSQTADVFVNGEFVGSHSGAFNAFSFDISKQLKVGENTLLVKATNKWDKNIAPLGGDFTLFGGIYRPVKLLFLNKISVTALDYASSGIYVKQKSLTDGLAEIQVEAKILNSSASNKKVKVRFTILTQDNKIVASKKTSIILNKTETKSAIQNIAISNPIRWNGLENPYQYKVKVEVISQCKTQDIVEEKFGLRDFEIDPEKGAFLNGKPYKIKGVNKHQDFKGMGWAISNKQIDEDFKVIKEIGANGIRLAHYPHSKYTYSVCDSLGYLVWAEIPLVNSITGSKEFADNAKLQLRELIRQNYNNPSIVFWSIYNEMGHRKTDDPQQLLLDLNELAHAEDPSRYTAAAANVIGRVEKHIPDVLAFNSYPGWYVDMPDDMKVDLHKWNDTINKKGIGVSEYGAGGSIKQHQQNMTKPPLTVGHWHPEEWQSIVHERNYSHIEATPFCWGSFVWNMFDFASAGRSEGDTVGMNDKGLVTYDRIIRKDAFYFYKANWSKIPFVYISSRRDVQRVIDITDIKIFSNCSEVKLSVNGIEFKSIQPENGTCIWKNIQLQEGLNKIKVTGTSANGHFEDECEWIYSKANK